MGSFLSLTLTNRRGDKIHQLCSLLKITRFQLPIMADRCIFEIDTRRTFEIVPGVWCYFVEIYKIIALNCRQGVQSGIPRKHLIFFNRF